MATERSLEAEISAVSNVEETLEGIADTAEEASDAFNELGIESSVAGASMEKTEESASDLDETLGDVVNSCLKAASGLSVVKEQADEAGEEAQESAGQFAALHASIAAFQGQSLALPDDISGGRTARLNTEGIEDKPSFGDRVRRTLPDLTLSRTAEVDTEVEYDSPRLINQIKTKVPDLSVSRTVEVDSEIERDSPRLIDSLQNKMPDLSLPTSGIREAESEVEDLNRDLSKTSVLATAASGALASMGGMTLGDRSTLPSPGSGDSGDSDGIDMAFTMPDLPSPDFSFISKGFGNIIDSGSDAAGVLGEVAGGLTQVLGISKNVAGLARIAGALSSIGGSAGALTSIIGGLTGILALVGPVVGGLISIGGALAGLATAAIGLTGAVAGLIGAGLFQIGKRRNPENPFKGIQGYLKTFQDDVKQALQPIFELQGLQGFIEGFISGGINALRDFSEMTAQLWPDIQSMFSDLGEIWSNNQPEFFYQLEKLISSMMPIIESLIGSLIKSAPGIIKSMRNMGTTLLPKMIDMFSALWGVFEPFIPSGIALASIIMDLATIFFELITPISDLLGMALTPLLQGLAWTLDLLVGPVKELSDGFSAFIDWLNKWIGALWNAITSLDATRIVKIINNFIGILVVNLANGLIGAFAKMYNRVMGWIKSNIPGAKQAIKGMNAASKGLTGQKAIPTKLEPKKWKPMGMFSDLNTNKPGKQVGLTSPSQELSGQSAYAGSGSQGQGQSDRPLIGEQNVTYQGSGSKPQMSRRMRQAVEQAARQNRQRTSASN